MKIAQRRITEETCWSTIPITDTVESVIRAAYDNGTRPLPCHVRDAFGEPEGTAWDKFLWNIRDRLGTDDSDDTQGQIWTCLCYLIALTEDV